MMQEHLFTVRASNITQNVYLLFFVEIRTMDKVQKLSSNECYTPSSEPFRMYYLECWYDWHEPRMQRNHLTFVRWETVAVRNFSSDVVLQSFEMVLELFGRHPSEAFVCVLAGVPSGHIRLLWGPRLLCILVQH
jgi:hypothetical protein